MCFEVLPLNPHGAEDKDDDEDGTNPVDEDGSAVKSSKRIWHLVVMSSNGAFAARCMSRTSDPEFWMQLNRIQQS